MPQKIFQLIICLFSVGSGLLLAQSVIADTAPNKTAPTETLPKPFMAKYAGEEKVAVFTVNAALDLELSRVGDYLKYTSNSQLKWSFYDRKFYDCSIIKIDKDKKLWPVEYLHVDEGDPDNRIETKFDWDAKTVTTHRPDKDKPRSYDITWPTWDPMSLQIALMTIAPQQKKGATQKYASIEKGKLREYEVTFNGEVKTQTHLPDIQVVEVLTVRGDNTGGLWFAPNYGWVPAKIQIDEVTIDLQEHPTFTEQQTASSGDVPSCAR